MKLPRPHSLQEIAAMIGSTYIGSGDHVITGINEIHMVEPGDIVFVDHPKYYQKALSSAATTIIIDQQVECPEGKALLLSEKPFDDFNRLTKHFAPFITPVSDRGERVSIDPSAIIYPNVYIGNDVTIGANTIIHAGAVIGDRTIIEDHVVIGPNAVIGHYAFYYKRKAEGYDRMHSCGGVKIKSRAEIGALCTIDSGVSGLTVVGRGTKLDNHVHIGHDTVIGDDCLFAANVGLAGCVRVEDRVTLWGQVGCTSDVTIGEGAVVLAQSGISKSLEGGKTYFGSPCGEVKLKFREMAAIRKLPELIDKL